MVSAIRPARRTAYGLEDPEALFASFRPYIDTGPGVMAGVANKMDEMTEIIKNPYDQQDPATYRVKSAESSHGIANGRAATRQAPSLNHRRSKLVGTKKPPETRAQNGAEMADLRRSRPTNQHDPARKRLLLRRYWVRRRNVAKT
jgi:hypothetical protein